MEDGLPINVVYLEDNPDDVEIIKDILRQGGFAVQVHRVETEEEFKLAVRVGKPTVILADCKMPTYTAREALHFLKEENIDIPLIVITGEETDKEAVSYLREGAFTYILKDRPARLSYDVHQAIDDLVERRTALQTQELLRGHVATLETAQDHLNRANSHQQSAEELIVTVMRDVDRLQTELLRRRS